MKTINVTIEGTSPLLMNKISLETQKQIADKSRKVTKTYPVEEEAEQRAYRKKGTKELCVPANCLKACILNAAGWYKFNNRSAKQIIAGATRIEPFEIGLGTNDYEIDLRTVVIQSGAKRNRVVRARPRLDEWKLAFKIIYNDSIISDPKLLKEIISEAGIRSGLLDNRPQYFGDNGTFRIAQWKEI
jgi:hypothetical protein